MSFNLFHCFYTFYLVGNAAFHSGELYGQLLASISPLCVALADPDEKTRANAAGKSIMYFYCCFMFLSSSTLGLTVVIYVNKKHSIFRFPVTFDVISIIVLPRNASIRCDR